MTLSLLAPARFPALRRAVLLLLLSLLSTAFAHWADLAAVEIALDENHAAVVLTVPSGLLPDGADREALGRFLQEKLRLEGGRDGATPITVTVTDVVPAAETPLGIAPGSHTTVLLDYSWEAPGGPLTLTYDLFLPEVPTATALVSVSGPSGSDARVLTPEHRRLTLRGADSGVRRFAQRLGSFVRLGVEHILGGFDHLLFLLTLLLLGGVRSGRLGYLLKVVTAFTVAHSLTLSLAVLEVVTLPPRLVESGIALSIAVVAAENLWRDPRRAERGRGLITFAFGLIHGLGFAGVLRGLELPRGELAGALFGFNLGVELGQLAVVAFAFALLKLLTRFSWQVALRRGLSGGALGLALLWFAQRALLS